MTFLERQSRKRLSLGLALGALAAYYAFIFHPLAQQERSQQGPFEQLQLELQHLADHNPAVSGLALGPLNELETDLQNSIAATTRARAFIVEHFAPEPAIATNMSRPWQLIDYQNERQQRKLALEAMARERGVEIKTPVVAGLPELRGDTVRRELLWGQLGVVDAILRSAVAVEVSSLDDVQVPDPVFHSTDPGTGRQLVEIPMRVSVSGNWLEVSRFLSLLLLDKAGREKHGLPVMENLPGLCLRHIMARKGPPDGPATIQLEAEFSGFVEILPEPDIPR